jgi:hypothetical protein
VVGERALAAAIGALLLLCSVSASARPPSADEIARGHYRLGTQRYDHGDFRGAIEEFSAGYAVVPLPHFQFDIARAYERLGELDSARTAYQRFLAGAAPDDRFRERAESAIEALTRILNAATPPTPTPTPPVEPVQLLPPEPVPLPVPVPVEVVVTAPPVHRGVRHWWLIPVSLTVATGVAVTLGVLLTRSPKDNCATASLGCLPLGH